MPVVDEIAAEYQDRVRFIAVAGRSDLAATSDVANRLISNVEWGLGDPIWDLYEVPYQPVTFLITGDDIVFETFAGVPYGADELRGRIDALLATS
ncbi:MAG: hypothetical protein QNJ88_11385 [Acidimicrobiia bacterium]|nr:hypothetical protein [Acidimicrobiia bacterium]